VEPAFDVVAVVGSAGGVDALAGVLQGLPADFPAPVVVVQHLSDQGRALSSILRRRIRLGVEWATEGLKLEAGLVVLCPPASSLVALPDGTVSLVPAVLPQDRPCDILLESVAETHGAGALAVILAGGGRDGVAGARAVKEAGGTVVAEAGPAPTAAVAAGAVDLVLPRDEIGAVLLDLVAGHVRARDRVFVGETEAAAHLRALDWSSTPLGPVAGWPTALAAAVRTALDSPLPTIVHWGPDLVVVPNDASRALLGADFARVTGRPLRDAWPEDWAANGPVHLDVLETGRARVVEDAPFLVDGGQVFLTSALSALRVDQGGIAGTLSTAIDTTARVLGRRQDDLLHRLHADVLGGATVVDAAERAAEVLGSDPGLVPFALVYLLDGPRTRAQLAASTGLEAGTPAAPRTISLGDSHPMWPVDEVTRPGPSTAVVLVDDRPPETGAVVAPLRLGRDERAAGAVVLGLDPRRPLDPAYRGFLDQVAARLADGLTGARGRQQERARQDAQADGERARTEFFANVSHEFRTPLTLLLGPLEAALARPEALPPDVADDLDLAHRSALRLLRMVQSLLDFSEIEVGRRRGSFEAIDLSALTRELAGVFESAADAAGLRLVVDCQPLPEPVWVDPGMWERIVSNLLSNALKFTLSGHVTVTLRLLPSHVELDVADTGSGIPESEIPHVFERFHRVEGVTARTREGTGIGLAMVDDLVRLHHGRVRVRSRLGEGSTFTVWIPRGRRLDGGPPPATDPGVDPRRLARSHADEAWAWSAPTVSTSVPAPSDGGPAALAPGARVLVVDDNADMRRYLRRLLGRHWEVDVAAHGAEARARLASASPPDLVLVDVMMPEVDGLTFVRQLRADPRLGGLPVVLLSARAGEDATVAGLRAGADDYVVKPFSARELVARVGAQLELARLRRQHDQAVRTGEDRLQLALEASGFVAFEWDTLTNRVAFLGGDGRALYGVTGDDIAELVDVVHDDDLAEHLASLQGALTRGERSVSEFRVRHPDGDGAVRWIRSVAGRLPHDPRRMFGVSTDVTERRTADDGLARATESLRDDVGALARYQDLSSRLLAVSDFDRLLAEVLDGAIELHGADGGTVCLYDPSTGELEVVARGGGRHDPYPVLRPDGAGIQSTPLVDRDGRPLGVVTTSTRHPSPRSDLERGLAELYLGQAVVLVAARSGAAAGSPAPAAEEATQEASHQAGGDEVAHEAAADAEEVGVDGVDLTDDDPAVAPHGGEVGG